MAMIKLKIDQHPVRVPEGSTVLDAARKTGIEIPTLCHLEGYEIFTSCMVCMVKDLRSGSLLPACSAIASEGMEISTDCAEVISLRKDALDLLLSEHIGDCEAPCQRTCPAHMNIPLMNRHIVRGELEKAIITVKDTIALPAVLGRICPAPCEKACHRSQMDGPVSICLLKRRAADADLGRPSPYDPPKRPASGKKVAVIGAGPAGLAASFYLALFGHAVTLFDEHELPGGMLRYGVPEEILPRDVLDAEIGGIRRMGVRFRMGIRVDKNSWKKIIRGHHAVVLATGEPADGGESLIEKAKSGLIPVKTDTFETEEKGVFAGGNAVRTGRLAIRSLAHGRSIAFSTDQYLSGDEIKGLLPRFQSQIGRLKEEDVPFFIQEAANTGRLEPGGGSRDGFSPEEAVKEAARCMHCDCRKPVSCRLRGLAEIYGADQRQYKRPDRKPAERILQHEFVVYEPGKCIKCGRCVRITKRAGEALGMTFIGRGFQVRIDAPFHEPLRKALEKTAEQCIKACPTGALSYKETEEESI